MADHVDVNDHEDGELKGEEGKTDDDDTSQEGNEDSLDIKPPQAVTMHRDRGSSKRDKSSRKDRHTHKSSSHRSRDRHHRMGGSSKPRDERRSHDRRHKEREEARRVVVRESREGAPPNMNIRINRDNRDNRENREVWVRNRERDLEREAREAKVKEEQDKEMLEQQQRRERFLNADRERERQREQQKRENEMRLKMREEKKRRDQVQLQQQQQQPPPAQQQNKPRASEFPQDGPEKKKQRLDPKKEIKSAVNADKPGHRNSPRSPPKQKGKKLEEDEEMMEVMASEGEEQQEEVQKEGSEEEESDSGKSSSDSSDDSSSDSDDDDEENEDEKNSQSGSANAESENEETQEIEEAEQIDDVKKEKESASEDDDDDQDYIEDSPPTSSPELKPQLPPYFPAIQGCRNVEEFHCLNRIEEGTYGVVFRARDKRTDEIVALKRLKMEKEKEGFPITSLREINTLLKSQHPNIVTVREIVVGSNMDKIYIVMDFVAHDLKSLMETMKQPFLVGEVKTLMIQLLRAVAHLHDNWILHRDLKTSNLLLSHKGILKVGDFGLAREYGSPLKEYTPVVVTLWYRAPELLLGIKEYSTPIDVWSVGCIFGELLTMKPLFNGKNEVEQLDKIFRDLGTPHAGIWPGYTDLPVVKKITFTEYPYNTLRNRFNQIMLTDLGFDLMNRFLTYNPERRVTAEEALKHEYFKETPMPVDPSMFPTWPARHERNHVRITQSPKPPSGGKQYAKQLGEEDEDIGSGGFHMNLHRPGAGFNLKF